MKIVVTSKNPVKLEATKRAFELYFPQEKIEIIAIPTDSKVSEQPMSAQETATGARNRAKSIVETDADYIVGIEGGLSFVEVDGTEYAFEQTYGCVVHHETDVSEIGAGPAYPLPHSVTARIKQGSNLTDAMRDEYGTVDLGKNAGYNGWLSENKIDRTEASKIAIFLALCGVMKDEYQNRSNSM